MELEYTTTLPLTDVVVTIVFDYTPYDSGRISGPPEDCYPPEGGEAEINEIYINRNEISHMLTPRCLTLLQNTCETWARERQSCGEL